MSQSTRKEIMAIYLTGGGEQENFNHIDQDFLSSLPTNAKILILPQACENDEYQDVLERIEDAFNHKKIASFELCLNPEKLTWPDLEQYSALMIEGGNTFKLIKAIRDSSFFALLKKFATTHKSIYADSAGAILLGADVETAFLGEDGDEDEQKLQDYRGLDILHPWAVHAHYEPDDYESLQDMLYAKGCPIIALPEEGAVKIEENEILSMGKENIDLITFSGKIVLSPDEKFTLI